MTWRLAQSLISLRAQIDAAHPHRPTASDGTIASAAHHAQNPNSDHDPNAHDVVTAIDITAAPFVDELVARLRASRDRRIAYMIWQGRICDGEAKSGTGGGGIEPWTWRTYDGRDPHTSHLHLSVSGDPHRYDDPRPWAVTAADELEQDLARGDHGPRVTELEEALHAAHVYTGRIDGLFGPMLEEAVNTYKHRHGWPQDGRAGRRVLEALGIGA